MMSRLFQLRFWRLSIFTLLLIVTQSILVRANASISAADVPMLALKSAPGLVMLTMSRDQRLFYSAYNDSSDLNGDGVMDVGFKPSITYYGYFASDRCYAYDSTNARFSPKSLVSATDVCFSAPSSARWNGNWLNWATTSRMDALRRVLYGGYRVRDPSTSSTPTVLQGAFIPQDAHVWGKEYRPVSGRDLNVYYIENYTPLSAPTPGKQHLFVVKSGSFSTNPSSSGSTAYPFPMPAPILRVITNADQSTQRIWDWAAGDGSALGANSPTLGGTTFTPLEYTVKVEVCVPLSGAYETGCKGYPVASPTVWKPTGVLHDYSANDSLKFGLLTGSYAKNYSGGVVRRNVASFNDEVTAANGRWKQVTEGSDSVDGIARTIDRISLYGWTPQSYWCGSSYTAARDQGACPAWGAPVSEMMYEGLRYFSGKSSPTSAFFSGVATTSTGDSRLNLPLIGTSTSPWANPFRAKSVGGNPICSKPVQMVIADPVTSYDSDQLPGAYFPLIGSSSSVSSSDLTAWGASTLQSLSDSIWTSEGLGTRDIFIGQVGSPLDGNPTAKRANSFYNIRGHAPDGAMAQGSYYAAAVSSFGHNVGVTIGDPAGSPAVAAKNANVDNISVALGSVVPRILIPNNVSGTKYVTIVPVAKSVANLGIDKSPGAYQATGTITGFFLDYSYNTSGTTGADYDASQNGGRPKMQFTVNFSDSDEGTDNESDAIVEYTVSVNSSGNLVVQITPIKTNIAGIQMQIGYAVSGTTKDGLYLDMRTQASSQIYYLDTLTTPTVATAQDPAPNAAPYRTNTTALPATATSRTLAFNTTGTSSASYLPHDPLWYAAKYGGANDLASAADPTNYFKVTSPADLPAQMGKAFRSAAALAAVASTSVVGVGQRSAGTAAIYQSSYDSLTWSSRLYAFAIGTNGVASNTASWDASQLIGGPSTRNLYLGRGGTTTPVALTATGTNWGTTSLTSAEQANFGDFDQYKYLLGDKTYEERKAVSGHVAYRNRGTTFLADAVSTQSSSASVLGDVVNSDPQIVSQKNYGYTIDTSYTSFVNSIAYETLAVSANDGFFHVFDASLTSGVELFGFMPRAASVNVKDLTSPAYSHRYFLDGPIAVGHAKIPVNTDTSTNWRSVLIGTGGLGAKTVFAIDASSKTFTAASVLWELDVAALGSTNGDKLGHVVGRPQIGKLGNGTWVAIFANGYNSTNDKAYLFVVNLQTGALIKVLDTNVTTGNGLTSIAIVRKTSGDTDAIDYVYGADYLGNIWRFDLSSSASSFWTTSLIYSSSSGRNITSEIAVGTAPAALSGGVMIYFGTGRYLTAADAADTTSVNALYGIYDDQLWSNATTAYISSDTNLSTGGVTMASAVADTRSTTMPSTSWWLTSGKKGWFVPLTGTNVQAGERVIAQPVRYTQAGKVDAFLFTSIVPGTDECLAGLDTWVTAIDALTGAPALAFKNLTDNAVKVVGGSPRGVFVLSETKSPTLYISQTVFSTSSAPTSSYGTIAGGSQTVCVNGVCGQTRVLGIELTPGSVTSTPVNRRQVWRQLK